MLVISVYGKLDHKKELHIKYLKFGIYHSAQCLCRYCCFEMKALTTYVTRTSCKNNDSKSLVFIFVFQTALMKDATISVNRCLWSPDGSILGMLWLNIVLIFQLFWHFKAVEFIEFTFVYLLGVAFSKHIIQTYNFIPNGDMRQMLEVSILLQIVVSSDFYIMYKRSH